MSSSDEENEKWEYKPEKPEPMSQQQWNEMKRTERNPEFAPPSTIVEESFNRFTAKKPKPIKRRNENAYENMYSEPIRNELDGNDFPVNDDNESNKRRRAEVAPPATFDYYGPTSTTAKPKNRPPTEDITASIEAGLKFLRDKSDKSAPGTTKQSWVANATYEQ